MNMDKLIDNILDSYEQFGGINKAGLTSFPNRENVVQVLHDLQCLVFPGYRNAEEIDSNNLRYITGQRVNRIVTILTREIQKALIYTKAQTCSHEEIANIFHTHHTILEYTETLQEC